MDIGKLINDLGENKNEILKKAAQCENVSELLALAEENGITLSDTDAAELFEAFIAKNVELSDDELDAVAGGSIIDTDKYNICPNCGNQNRYCKCSRYNHQQ